MSIVTEFIGKLKRKIFSTAGLAFALLTYSAILTYKVLDGSEVHVGVDIIPAKGKEGKEQAPSAVQPPVYEPQFIDLSGKTVFDVESGQSVRFSAGTYIVILSTPENTIVVQDSPNSIDPSPVLEELTKEPEANTRKRKRAKEGPRKTIHF